MLLTIRPSSVNGSIGVPGSKSHTIRGVICGILAEGKSTLRFPLESDDTKAAIGAILLEVLFRRIAPHSLSPSI